MLREAQSIWQISVLTDGAPSIQQSICFILILSNVYSRIWTQYASLPRLQWLLYSISALLLDLLLPSSLLRLFSPARNDFLAIRAKATLSPHSESAMGYAPPPQVGQPNRAIRQDIHHYPAGWSKWPWCSLHTQFQIPLGSIMGRFKQRERGRPSHLILAILDVISVWCSAERESNTGGTGEGGVRWRRWVSRWWKHGAKLRWSKRAPWDEKWRWLKIAGRASR